MAIRRSLFLLVLSLYPSTSSNFFIMSLLCSFFLFLAQPGPFFHIFSFAKNASYSLVALFPPLSLEISFLQTHSPLLPSPLPSLIPSWGSTSVLFQRLLLAPCFAPRYLGQFIYLRDLFFLLTCWRLPKFIFPPLTWILLSRFFRPACAPAKTQLISSSLSLHGLRHCLLSLLLSPFLLLAYVTSQAFAQHFEI